LGVRIPPAAQDKSPGHPRDDLGFSLSGSGVRVRLYPAVVGSWRAIVPNTCPSFAAQYLADPAFGDLVLAHEAHGVGAEEGLDAVARLVLQS
jgi:hypothetical protein